MKRQHNKQIFSRTLLSVAIALTVSEVHAGFDLSRLNQNQVDRDKWQCSSCPDIAPRQASIHVSSGYLSKNDVSQIIAGHGDKQGLQGNAGISYRQTGEGRKLSVSASGGTGPEHLSATAAKENDYTVDINHNSQLYINNLDIDIVPANNSGLQPSHAGNFDEEVESGITSVNAEKTLTDNLQGFAGFSRKTRSGNKVETDHEFGFTTLGAIPKEVDDTTHELQAGLRHVTDASQLQADYTLSLFDNNAKASREVAVGQGQGVGGGSGSAQSLATRNPEPDSILHRATATGSYKIGVNDIVQASAVYSILGQDGELTGGQVADNGNDHLEGYIHTARSRLRWLHRISPKWRLKTSFSYDNRKNITDSLQKTSDNNVVFSTRLFSYRSQDYRAVFNGQVGKVRLETGARNKIKWRSDQNRQKTDEKTAWVKGRRRFSNNLMASGTLSHLNRGGSDFDNEGQALEAYLADLKQNKVNLGLSYNGFTRAGLDSQIYLTQNKYDSDQSGLDNLERMGLIINGNYLIDDHRTVYAATTLERNQYEQSITFNPNTSQLIDQTMDMWGLTLGFEWENLLDNKLDIDISYNWMKSIDDYNQRNAQPIPDVSYRSSLFEASGKYRFNKNLTLVGMAGYQSVSEDDWQLDNSLWTGNKSLDDEGYRLMAGIIYKFL